MTKTLFHRFEDFISDLLWASPAKKFIWYWMLWPLSLLPIAIFAVSNREMRRRGVGAFLLGVCTVGVLSPVVITVDLIEGLFIRPIIMTIGYLALGMAHWDLCRRYDEMTQADPETKGKRPSLE